MQATGYECLNCDEGRVTSSRQQFCIKCRTEAFFCRLCNSVNVRKPWLACKECRKTRPGKTRTRKKDFE